MVQWLLSCLYAALQASAHVIVGSSICTGILYSIHYVVGPRPVSASVKGSLALENVEAPCFNASVEGIFRKLLYRISLFFFV